MEWVRVCVRLIYVLLCMCQTAKLSGPPSPNRHRNATAVEGPLCRPWDPWYTSGTTEYTEQGLEGFVGVGGGGGREGRGGELPFVGSVLFSFSFKGGSSIFSRTLCCSLSVLFSSLPFAVSCWQEGSGHCSFTLNSTLQLLSTLRGIISQVAELLHADWRSFTLSFCQQCQEILLYDPELMGNPCFVQKEMSVIQRTALREKDHKKTVKTKTCTTIKQLVPLSSLFNLLQFFHSRSKSI